jgi:hypothetical protein
VKKALTAYALLPEQKWLCVELKLLGGDVWMRESRRERERDKEKEREEYNVSEHSVSVTQCARMINGLHTLFWRTTPLSSFSLPTKLRHVTSMAFFLFLRGKSEFFIFSFSTKKI